MVVARSGGRNGGDEKTCVRVYLKEPKRAADRLYV